MVQCWKEHHVSDPYLVEPYRFLCRTHYEYLAVYSDDIIVASKDPKAVYVVIQKTYTMKGVGVPEYFLGAACGHETGPFNYKGSTSTLSAKVYIQNLIPRLEKELGVLRNYTVPMDPEYRPELDETPLLGEEDTSKFLRKNRHCLCNHNAFETQYVPSRGTLQE